MGEKELTQNTHSHILQQKEYEWIFFFYFLIPSYIVLETITLTIIFHRF